MTGVAPGVCALELFCSEFVEVSVDSSCKYVTKSPPIMSQVLAAGSTIGLDALNCNE